MNTEIILKVDKLENLANWLAWHVILGERSTKARALYMFANKPGTLLEYNAIDEFAKFDSEKEAEKYLNALSQTKFIIESKLVDEITWVYNRGTQGERRSVTQVWRITVTPSTNNAEDAFVAYCPKPYNPV